MCSIDTGQKTHVAAVRKMIWYLRGEERGERREEREESSGQRFPRATS